jgi:hypothetical protein
MESLESRTLLTVTTLTVNSISDGSFEAPALAANAYQLDPASSPWQYSGAAGVSRNSSAFTVGNPSAPNGAQVAFLKNNASIIQTVDLDPGVYNLSLLAAQRTNFQTQSQEIEVLIDGTPIGAILPASTSYVSYQTPNFTVATTANSVELLGMSPASGDSTAFIDEVAIAPVVDTLLDTSFTQPALAVNSSATDPTGGPWQFSGTSGLTTAGSTLVANSTETLNAPAGTQFAYLEDTGSMSQTVYLDTGTYQLSLWAVQRAFNQTYYQDFEILLDGNVLLDSGQPDIIDPAGSQFADYQSSTFTVTAGPHTIELLGLNPLGGDNTAFIDQATISTATVIGDGSFETPALAAGQDEFAPAGSSWVFSAGAGIVSNNSTIASGNPAAPDGTQVAILQGDSSISQSVNLTAGSYNISFQAAQDASNTQSLGQQIQVMLGSTQVGLITPFSTSYSLYETTNFTVPSGTYNLQFTGLNQGGGNNSALIDLVSLAPAQDQITDGGFQSPGLAAGSYQLEPGGAPWQFSGSAGVSANKSAITSGNPSAPAGTQVAYISDNGVMSYSVYLDADTYSLSFLAAQRVNLQSRSQEIEILVDNSQQIGWITPSGSSYNLYQTANFTVAAGPHSIEFIGLSPSTADSTVLIDQVALTTAENTFSDGGFESPALAAGAYQLAPAGSGWQFSGTAGVSGNNSAFTTGNPNAPAGTQVAFLKDNASISQSVYFDAGTYNISFLADQRDKFQTQNQQIEVLVNGLQVGLITPSGTTYAVYETSNFTVAAGAYPVQFVGLAPVSADSTAFIDSASINAGCAISDGSFEQPALAAGAYQVAPNGASWLFSGDAGVSGNNSAFTTGNPSAPDGTQVAFLKNNAAMSQSVYLAAGFYNLSFMAAQRDKSQTQYQSLQIWVDSQLVGTITPTGTTYGTYQTSNFTVAAGLHAIKFVGLNPTGGSDNTAFVDEVQLNV